jgi:pyruvyl transferase EpsO
MECPYLTAIQEQSRVKSELNLFNGPLDAVVAQLRFRVAAHARPGYALLDFPHYANVGDSAIWSGTLTLLRAITGRDPAYVSGQHDLDDAALRAAVPEGPIFLAGGGNFGDLWNHHQTFREGVIARFRDRPVVQLPQSIHYTDPARIARTARIIAAHPDFTLLVRDEPSRALALRHFDCPVALCPDTALAIGPVAPAPARVDVLALLRTDKEGAGVPPLPSGIPVEDWVDENRLAVRRVRLAATLRAWSALAPANARARACEAAARHRFERGLRQIAQGRAIVTDRLHVHILALLLGRPHAVLDNVYGKIGGVLDAFTGVSPLVYRATDLADALAWAEAARERKAA